MGKENANSRVANCQTSSARSRGRRMEKLSRVAPEVLFPAITPMLLRCQLRVAGRNRLAVTVGCLWANLSGRPMVVAWFSERRKRSQVVLKLNSSGISHTQREKPDGSLTT